MGENLDKKIEKLERMYGVESPTLNEQEKERSKKKIKRIEENFDNLVDPTVGYTEEKKSEVVDILHNKIGNGFELEGTLKEIVNKRLAINTLSEVLSDGESLEEVIDSGLPNKEEKLKYVFKWQPSLMTRGDMKALADQGYLADFMIDSLTGKDSRRNVETEIVDDFRLMYDTGLLEDPKIKKEKVEEFENKVEGLAEHFDRRRYNQIANNFEDLVTDEIELLGYRTFEIEFTESQKSRVLENLESKIGELRGYKFGSRQRLVNQELAKLKYQDFIKGLEEEKIREKGKTDILAEKIAKGEVPEDWMYFQLEWNDLRVSPAYERAEKMKKGIIEKHITEIEEIPENNEWVYT